MEHCSIKQTKKPPGSLTFERNVRHLLVQVTYKHVISLVTVWVNSHYSVCVIPTRRWTRGHMHSGSPESYNNSTRLPHRRSCLFVFQGTSLSALSALNTAAPFSIHIAYHVTLVLTISLPGISRSFPVSNRQVCAFFACFAFLAINEKLNEVPFFSSHFCWSVLLNYSLREYWCLCTPQYPW